MRVISAPELTLLQGKTFKSDERLEIENVDGTWVDVSDRLIAAEITDDVDQKAVSVVFTLARDSGDANAASLSPLMESSTRNVDDSDVYAPLVTAGARFRFSVACVALTATFAGATYHELITGRFDKPSFAAAEMTVEGRDLGGLLIDTIAIVDATYGDEDDPAPAVDAGQQYLDDNVGDDAPTLVDESGTDFVVTAFRQVNVPVMEGLNALATKAGGLVIRYKYDSSGVAQLTLFDPLRANTTPAVTLTPSRYIEIPQAAIDSSNVRNIIRGEFLDPVTGEVLRLEVRDTDSIEAFGPRFMQLSADVFEGLTNNEVLTVLESALADLALPKFDHEVRRLLFWPVEIGDVIEWAANGVHYDDAQTLAVVGYTHRFEKGEAFTTFRCRGTPAGAYLDWIRRQGTGPTGPQIPPAPELMFALGEATQFGGTVDTVDGGIWLGYRMPAGVDEIRAHVLLGLTQDIGVPNIDNTTLALTIRRPEGDLGTPAIGVENMFPNRPGEYASLALLSTRPGLYKRILFYGVRDNLTSVPVITPARPAIDPSPTRIDGTIADMEIVRDGSTNTITVTPGTLESTDDTRNGNWLCLMRNEHVLPPVYIKTDTTPVVFVDSGLPEDASYEAVYDAFIWNGGQSGPTFSGVAEAPTIEPPEWANGTPLPAMEGGTPKIQLSWTCDTPGATGVRVEASLDGVSKRTVGTGGLTGTVYDADTTAKLYRLVAVNILGVALAVTSWKWSTSLPPTISNPSGVPQILTGYPRVVMKPGSNIFSPTFVLAIAQRTATPGATWVRIQESDDNGVGDPWALVTNGESTSVAAWTWYSPDSTAIGEDKWYRVQAIAADGSTVLATSTAVHFVPAT